MKKLILSILIIAFLSMGMFSANPKIHAQVQTEKVSTDNGQAGFIQKIFQNVLGWIFSHNNKKSGNISVPVDDVKKESSKNKVNYTNWSVYSKYGFKISYPTDLNFDIGSEYYCKGRIDCGNSSDSIYIYNYTADKEYDRLKKNLSKNEFRIKADISLENENINLDSITPTYNEAHNKIVSERIVLNGFNIAVIKNEWDFPIIYYLVNKKTKVTIYVNYKNADQNTKDLIQNIISSITFTD